MDICIRLHGVHVGEKGHEDLIQLGAGSKRVGIHWRDGTLHGCFGRRRRGHRPQPRRPRRRGHTALTLRAPPERNLRLTRRHRRISTRHTEPITPRTRRPLPGTPHLAAPARGARDLARRGEARVGAELGRARWRRRPDARQAQVRACQAGAGAFVALSSVERHRGELTLTWIKRQHSTLYSLQGTYFTFPTRETAWGGRGLSARARSGAGTATSTPDLTVARPPDRLARVPDAAARGARAGFGAAFGAVHLVCWSCLLLLFG